MEQQEIEYCEVIKLGFEREDPGDTVFFNEYGFEYFIVYLNVSKGVSFDWCPITRKVEMLRGNKKGDLLARHKIKDIDELIKWIKFFK